MDVEESAKKQPTNEIELSHQEWKQRSVEIINVEANEIPQSHFFNIMNYLFISYSLQVLFMIVIGVLVIQLYSSPQKNLFNIVLCCLIFNLIRIAVNVYYWLFVQNENQEIMRMTYIMEIILSVSMGLLFLGLLLAMSGKMDEGVLIYLAIVHIVMMFVRMVMSAVMP